MQKSSIDTIVFDLGGVLIDWNPRHLYRKLFEAESEMEDFLANVCDGKWNEMQDAGRSFDEAIAELEERFPRQSENIRAFRDRWPEMISGPIHGTVEILQALSFKKTHRLFALTNWSAETFPYAKKTFPFLSCFEGIVVSGEEKMIKPDPKFFRLLMERHSVFPERSVFIDDSIKNIAAADSLGFHTIHFKNPETLLARLRDLGVQT